MRPARGDHFDAARACAALSSFACAGGSALAHVPRDPASPNPPDPTREPSNPVPGDPGPPIDPEPIDPPTPVDVPAPRPTDGVPRKSAEYRPSNRSNAQSQL